MIADPPIAISLCDQCHSRFVPRPGPCPRCGSTAVEPAELAPTGSVLAATQLEIPPAGWEAPHRLALVELDESVRVLAQVEGDLPPVGSTVHVRRASDRFWVRR